MSPQGFLATRNRPARQLRVGTPLFIPMLILLLALAASALIVLVLQDAFEVMLLPRRVLRRFRVARFYFRSIWILWKRCARVFGNSARREHFLSVFGPLSMVLLFTLWATGLILGFGTLSWTLLAHAPHPSPLADQIYMSGVTFFTLGYGDVVPHSHLARMLSVSEAGLGFGFLALVIGYLPVLYQLFSRREAHVIQLDVRAGTPPTACTLLSRHGEPEGLLKLDELLREWEVWGSELLESHLSYPMLVYYRSQHDSQSWLAALAAVIDTCALILVGIEGTRPLQARMTFTMGRLVIVEMARSFGVSPSRYDGGDRLDDAAYRRLIDSLTEAGLHWTGAPGAQGTLAALRATYEPLLDGLADRLLLTLPPWSASGTTPDNWQIGHRGLIATRLVEQLSTQAATESDRSEDRLWRRLRAQLDR